jgi:hypothetical protein
MRSSPELAGVYEFANVGAVAGPRFSRSANVLALGMYL